MFALARAEHVTGRGDDLEGPDVVARQAGPPGQPAHPAAEGESTDAGVRHVAGGHSEPVLLGRPVERPEEGAALHDRPALSWVDADRPQGCQVDHQPAVGDRVAGRAMAAAPDADLEVVLGGGPDCRDDVANTRAPDDHPRTPVDDGVPDGSGLVVSRVAGQHHPSVQRAGKFLRRIVHPLQTAIALRSHRSAVRGRRGPRRARLRKRAHRAAGGSLTITVR